MRTALLMLLLAMASVSLYAEDIVYLKDGKEVRGRVVSEDAASVVVEKTFGTIKTRERIMRMDVRRIEKGPDIKAILARKLSVLDKDDPEEVRVLIGWCRANGELAIAKNLEADLEERLHEKWLQLNRDNLCPHCRGEGKVECPDCGGKGRVLVTCEHCDGKGEVLFECEMCVVNETTMHRIPEIGKPVVPRSYYSRKPDDPPIYARRIICPKCAGSGRVTVETRRHTVICPVCGGTKEIVCPKCKGKAGEMVPCRECKGEGKIKVKCRACDGKGLVRCPTCHGCGLENPLKEIEVE